MFQVETEEDHQEWRPKTLGKCVISASCQTRATEWGKRNVAAFRYDWSLEHDELEGPIAVKVCTVNEYLATERAVAKQLLVTTQASVSECQNCGKRWHEKELLEPKRIAERVGKGEPWPSGECPSCGPLCRPNNPKRYEGTLYGPPETK